MRRVLVVDDEENLRLVLRTFLTSQGYEVEDAATAESALGRCAEFEPWFVLADVRMPGMSGIEFCRALRQRGSTATVIVMSAYGSIDLALEAMQAGAYDYVAKPFKQEEILLALRKAEERELLRRENQWLRQTVRQQTAPRIDMLGDSAVMRQVWRMINKVAEHTTTVLIQGESGVGKELVAAAIHRLSPRADKAFVAVNCGAIPDALLESELFGHVRGAFTDATRDRTGLFVEADGGTLFLDEIGELPVQLQVKLLRVLQEGVLRPVGGTKNVAVDVRVVAATVRNLQDEVAAGRFREDLFYRLNILQLTVPPLRERRDDLTALLSHFLERTNARLGTRIRDVGAEARAVLLSYAWPGNVRELENVIERAAVLADGEIITLADLPERLQRPDSDVPEAGFVEGLSIKRSVRALEEVLIRRALAKTSGNRTAATKLLEISHRALLYKIKDYGIT